MDGLLRKFMFGWKFDGTKLFFSGYPTDESRVLFHRTIRERVHQAAPFLVLDKDPYIVVDEGRLVWILDAYTVSDRFPYSEPFSGTDITAPQGRQRQRTALGQSPRPLSRINYIRNSVKAVVDAFDGTVDLYVFEPEDPLIQAWDKVFPGLFKKREEMPENLLRHVRYPSSMLLTQGLVYAKYHMTDPTVFYNQEDLWVRATEKYYGDVRNVAPYYVMWELPDTNKPEFVLILPFTPKNRQVLNGWIAGMCDGENYGRFLAYKFSKEKRVLGPQQVETKIDQDRFLSGQLTLWDQRGSRVIRGNVLAIPIGRTILYVEPVYLQAETAAYPELRLVMVMHNDNLSYAENFEDALWGLFDEEARAAGLEGAGETGPDGRASVHQLASQADQAFKDYLSLTGEKKFDQAASALEELQANLQELMRRLDESGAGGETASQTGSGEKSPADSGRKGEEE